MLDRRFIIENAAAVKPNCANRGVTGEIDGLLALEAKRKALLVQVEELNRKANENGKLIGKAKDPAEKEAIKEQGRQLREQKEAVQVEHDQLDAQIHAIQLTIPNLSHPSAPVGVDDKSNLEIRRGQHEPRKFDFKPVDHVVLGE